MAEKEPQIDPETKKTFAPDQTIDQKLGETIVDKPKAEDEEQSPIEPEREEVFSRVKQPLKIPKAKRVKSDAVISEWKPASSPDQIEQKIAESENRIDEKVAKENARQEAIQGAMGKMRKLDRPEKKRGENKFLRNKELLQKEVLDFSDILDVLKVPEDASPKKKVDALYKAYERLQVLSEKRDLNEIERRINVKTERLLKEMENMTDEQRTKALEKVIEQEAEYRKIAVEKAEQRLNSARQNADSILSILENGKELDGADKKLIKKYLNTEDAKKFEKEGLNEKRVEYLKKQCKTILKIVDERFKALKDENLDEQELKKLGSKISRVEIKERMKQDLVQKTNKFNEIAQKIREVRLQGRNPDPVLIEEGQKLYKEIKESGGKKKTDVRDDEIDITVTRGVGKPATESTIETVANVATPEETEIEKLRRGVLKDLSHSEKDKETVERLIKQMPENKPPAPKEMPIIGKQEVNEKNKKYQLSGFWGKLKMELVDLWVDTKGVFRGGKKNK